MLAILALAYSALAGFGLAALVVRAAIDRNRGPWLWGAATVISAIAVVYAGYSMAARADFGDDVVTAGIMVLVGPLIVPGLVMLLLHWLPAAEPRVPASVAVRIAGEAGRLVIDADGLRLQTGAGERRITRPELARVEASGECLLLELRPEREELRLQLIEIDDAWRRRSLCTAIADALTRTVAEARARTR